jgi:hypothetical protein
MFNDVVCGVMNVVGSIHHLTQNQQDETRIMFVTELVASRAGPWPDTAWAVGLIRRDFV